MTNLNEQYERIQINGKSYIKSVIDTKTLKDYNCAGSFINVLANRISFDQAPGRMISSWR